MTTTDAALDRPETDEAALAIDAARAKMADEGAAESLALWQAVRERFPDDARGLISYGEALFEAGRFDAAKEVLSEACERFPDELSAWVQRARLSMRYTEENRPYFETLGPGDWTEPLQCWQDVRERFPDVSEGPVGYAYTLTLAYRFEEAKALFAEIVTQFPNEPWAWIHYAQTAVRCEDWTEALRCWKEVGKFSEHADRSYAGICMIAAAVQHQCNMLTHEMPVSSEVQRRTLEFMRLLKPHSVVGHRKARFGSKYDGGYVMVDDLNGINAAFSMGIANDANWDARIADRGVPVYQFDHTIDASPIQRKDLIFSKTRIAAQPGQDGQTITLDELVKKHGTPGKQSLILKIDIEADEWPVFDAASEEALSCFAQIAVEFHYLGNAMVDPEFYRRAFRVLRKLNKHFAVVHAHGVNGHPVCSIVNVMVPDIMEITFASRKRYNFGPTEEVFPTDLDAPCHPRMPEIHLGRFVY